MMETQKLEPFFKLDETITYRGDVNLYVWLPAAQEYGMQVWYSPPGSKRNRNQKTYAVWTGFDKPVARVATEEEAREMCLALTALEQ